MATKGIAIIQEKYLDKNHTARIASHLTEDAIQEIDSIKKKKIEINTESNANQNESENNSVKRDASELNNEPKKKKLKGRHKHRPVEKNPDAENKLCPAVIKEETCSFLERGKCKFTHDVAGFMAKKPADMEGECPQFSLYGKCIYSLACRFAGSHITKDFKNIVNEELWNTVKDEKVVTNTLDRDLLVRLRKKNYDFSRSVSIIKQNDKEDREEKDQQNNGTKALKPTDTTTVEMVAKSEDQEGDDIDKDNDNVGLSSLLTEPRTKKKVIDFRDKLYLAPLTTVGNLPFRRICKSLGVDITCGEMALPINIVKGQQSEWSHVKRHKSEDIFGVQLCSTHSLISTQCAQLLEEVTNVDFIDLNCGCPIDWVFEKGDGAGIMTRGKKLEKCVRGVKAVLKNIPLTLKLRTGVKNDKPMAHTIIPRLQELGVDMVTLHGRSREQRYTRSADWDYINQCASLPDVTIPIFGNGDILSYEEYYQRRNETNVSGIMIARGALIKPWIFTEIKEKRHWDISSTERLDILKDFVHHGLEHWGSDEKGIITTRRFLLEWLSFTHRYIPVGILEHVPQRIHEKPPYYFGRDNLETLMASANSADWVKITEMLLGPVSDGFAFLPKHKANSYQ